MRDLDRDELLKLTPDTYLADGYRQEDGGLRPELRDEYATAVASQFLAAELSPQELGFTVEGVRQLLPVHDEPDPAERLYATVKEATEVVARMIGQPNNETLRLWLYACVNAVDDDADIDAFMAHLDAVNRQYGLLASLVAELPPATPESLN